MKLAFSTSAVPGLSIEQLAGKAKAYGYEAVELHVAPDSLHLKPDATLKQAEEAASILKGAGVPVFSLALSPALSLGNKNDTLKSQKLLRKVTELAAGMQAAYVRIGAGEIPAGEAVPVAADRVAKALRPEAEAAKACGVKVALCTDGGWAGARVMEVIQRAECADGLGVVYDVCSAYSANFESWAVTVQKIRKQICYALIKDLYIDSSDARLPVMLGAGDLPIQKIISRLKRENFDGSLCTHWDAGDTERVLPQYAHKLRKMWTTG